MTTEIVSTEPATGAILWRGPVSDVDAEIDLARTAFAEWASRPLAVRVEAFRRFINVVRGKHDAFADTIARETGKPLWEARTEVDAVIAKVEISIDSYNERTAQRRLDGDMRNRQALRHKPHGIMAVLGPYNFPAHLPNGHIIPALIAGNAVVFKPSEKTPATGKLLVECYHAAGVPSGVVRCVIGGPEAGKALVGHRDIDGVLFTGSARTGIAINRQFADNPGKILALEMGGNNPIIVWDATDIYSAAIIIIQSAFTTAGQRCTAARRLIVRDGLHEPLMAQIKRLTERLIVADPHSAPPPFMGPVIDNEVADQLEESFLALIMKGGVPILHMERLVPGRPFLTPSIIDMTDANDRPDIELFGRGQQHALWPRGITDRGHPAALRSVLGQHPRRDRQLEQADQRRIVQSTFRRYRLVGEPPTKRLLRCRLLRLSRRLLRRRASARLDRYRSSRKLR
jgi:succinylglutamic semialdehyde dehydrogenase